MAHRWYVLLDKEELGAALGGCGHEGLLDMLRYEAARVESNAPEGYWLLGLDRAPTLARWASFGIPIAWYGGQGRLSQSEPLLVDQIDEIAKALQTAKAKAVKAR